MHPTHAATISYGEKSRKERLGDEEQPLSGLRLMLATFAHMRNPYQLLVIPLTVWSGIEQGYFGSEFTRVRSSTILVAAGRTRRSS